MKPSQGQVRIVSEAELQATILEMLQAFGWQTHHEYDSRIAPRGRNGAKRTDKGFPDIIARRRDPKTNEWRGLAIELKSEGGNLTPEQKQWLDFFSAIGFGVYVWWPHHLDTGGIEAVLR